MKGVERNEEKNGMGENEMGVGTSAKHCIHMHVCAVKYTWCGLCDVADIRE